MFKFLELVFFQHLRSPSQVGTQVGEGEVALMETVSSLYDAEPVEEPTLLITKVPKAVMDILTFKQNNKFLGSPRGQKGRFVFVVVHEVPSCLIQEEPSPPQEWKLDGERRTFASAVLNGKHILQWLCSNVCRALTCSFLVFVFIVITARWKTLLQLQHPRVVMEHHRSFDGMMSLDERKQLLEERKQLIEVRFSSHYVFYSLELDILEQASCRRRRSEDRWIYKSFHQKSSFSGSVRWI